MLWGSLERRNQSNPLELTSGVELDFTLAKRQI
jgi:hypothetical protein